MWKLKTSTLGISTNNPLFCLPPGRLKNTPARRVCFLKHPRGSAELSASPPHSDLPSECSLRPVVLPSLCRRAGQARSGFLGCNYGAGTAGISGVRHVDRQCWDRGQTLRHHHQVSCCALQTHTHTHTHTCAHTHISPKSLSFLQSVSLLKVFNVMCVSLSLCMRTCVCACTCCMSTCVFTCVCVCVPQWRGCVRACTRGSWTWGSGSARVQTIPVATLPQDGTPCRASSSRSSPNETASTWSPPPPFPSRHTPSLAVSLHDWAFKDVPLYDQQALSLKEINFFFYRNVTSLVVMSV